jgi:hypothetical protein
MLHLPDNIFNERRPSYSTAGLPPLGLLSRTNSGSDKQNEQFSWGNTETGAQQRRPSINSLWDLSEPQTSDIPQFGNGKSTPNKLRLQEGPVKRRKTDSSSPFAHVKLGDVRRKQLKSAISARLRDSVELRYKCREINRVKEASIAELFQMAEMCGLTEFAWELAENRIHEKEERRDLRRGGLLV